MVIIGVPLLSVYASGTFGLARAFAMNVRKAAATVIFMGSKMPVS